MAEKSIGEIMKKANELGIVIPAFNVAHLPMTEVIAHSLEDNQAFGLVEVSRPDIEKFGAQSFAKVAQEYKKYENLKYMRLHLDHTPVIDEEGKRFDWEKQIRESIELGFDSVMIDGSRLSLDENIAVTKKVADIAHPRNVFVEAELGAVLGHEKGPLPPYEELFKSGKGFTRVEEAERFVKETGVDWLSVAIGNIHGAISGASKDQKKLTAMLNVEHLKKLQKVTGVPLVLHGGSGIAREYVLEAIKHGISKINVGTEIRQAYEKPLLEKPNDIEYAKKGLKARMDELICDYYGIKGSAIKLSQD